MGNQLAKESIQAVLEGKWEKAFELNSKILADNPQDCEALNRLARVCLELGKPKKAHECYTTVLKYDPANSIAQKNFKLLAKSNGLGNGQNGQPKDSKLNGELAKKTLDLNIFLTEPGKTKLVNLVNLATPTTLSKLSCGEKGEIVFKKHQVIIENSDSEYLGALPDDFSHYLISLTQAGNNYEAYIKAVKTNSLSVLICEKKRSGKFANQPSFLSGRKTRVKPATAEIQPLNWELDEGFADF